MFFSFFYRFVMFKACNSQVCDNHQARQLLRPSRALPRQQGRPSRLPSAAISPAAALRPTATIRGIVGMEVSNEMQDDPSSREVRFALPWPPPGMRGVH